MKKYLAGLSIIYTFFILAPLATVHASTLGCESVDGASIFGYDGSHYKFIGAISNEYDSNSIANEYGAGSEYNSDSIMNSYGTFGSEYSSYSAFNDYTSSPPILTDDNSNFLGYLTTNKYLTPNINTYSAIACAKETYASSDSSMENVVFKNIPGSGGYSTTYSRPSAVTTVCPANAFSTANGCSCNSGYVANGSVCITETQSCINQYGQNSYGSGGSCYCSSGYRWNSAKTTCVQTPSCLEGFILNSDNQCITYTQSCREVNNNDANIIGAKDASGKINCSCISGYWNGSSCVESSQIQSAQTTVADPYAQLTSDERCVTLSLGTFFNTDKQSCDVCPSGTTRVSGTNNCQKPVPVVKKVENTSAQNNPVTKMPDAKKVISSKAATTSKTTSSSTTEITDTKKSWFNKIWKFIWRF